MDSFIFKGKSSEEFKIIVNSLPSISKPTLRVEEIEIDGVDGTRYEDLGYGSYDKKIKITITEDNIDSLIGWLKGEGDLTLSNEPDKYYKAKIIDQVNFSRLMKYEPTEITFRVQPFKYEYQEEEQTIATGSIEGTEIKINDVKATEIKLDGRSTQDGTPTPDTPVEIESVGYENLYKPTLIADDGSVIAVGNGTAEFSEDILKLKATGADLYFGQICVEGTTYNPVGGILIDVSKYDSISYKISNELFTNNYITYYDENLVSLKYIRYTASEDTIVLSNAPTGTKYVSFRIGVSGATIGETYETTVQVEKGSIVHPFIPYGKYGIEVDVVGKNLFNASLIPSSTGIVVSNNGKKITMPLNSSGGGYTGTSKTLRELAPNLKVGDIVWLNFTRNLGYSYNNLIYLQEASSSWTNGTSRTITQNDLDSIVVLYANSYGSGETEQVILTDFMISYERTTFVPYQNNKSVIVLNEPLRSLPNGVKDIAYIRNNKLYVDRYVDSFILKGESAEGWSLQTEGYRVPVDALNIKTKSILLSNYYKNYLTYNELINQNYGIGMIYGSVMALYVRNSDITTLGAFKTWLSEHNTQVDYELETPVTEELGDLTILELVDGENNISNSADTNMIVDYVDNKLIINNLGNYISKPTFEIEGAGTIKFILDGYSVFTYNFDEDGRVVIDSEKEDAYLGSVLKNRNMNGEFPKLEIGENIVTWDGLVKNIKAVKKSRWL